MTAGSLIEVVQEAIEETGMREAPLTDRTSFLSDKEPGYLFLALMVDDPDAPGRAIISR